jgi:hypothetical protein
VKAIRSLAASCTLLLASILAHTLSGGNALSAPLMIQLSLSSIFIALLLMHKSEDPVRATFAIFLAQNLGHFIVGGQIESGLKMALSHLVSGIVSYQLLRYFERNLPSLGSVYRGVIAHFSYSLPSIVVPRNFHPGFSYRSLATSYFSLTESLRAPPSY